MKRLLATTALVAAMAMPAMAAQQMDNTATRDQMTAARHMDGGMTVSTATLMGKALFTPEGAFDESMLDTPYTDAPDTWENIADIEDVLITADGEITAVVVDAGGFLGVGETRKRLSMDNIRIVPDEDDEGEYFALFTGDRSLIEDSEDYSAETAAANDEMSTRGAYAQMQNRQMGDGSMSDDGQMSGAQQKADRRVGPDRETLDRAETTDLTAENLEDARVYGSTNEWVGDVGDLVITEDGEITHMVVDVGGFLGIGEKPVAMTFDQVDIRRDGSWGGLNVYIEASEQQLERMERWEDET
ncbi:PRC-barrel domain-containing protein [Stappia sp.]|uniref:PRC-barrel domain-containing protein n=1 Tax=Stappia sp. TaxID=1870903 RepID=UPI0032D93625